MQEEFSELKRLMALGGIDADDLEKRLETFSNIDDDKALKALRQRINATAHTTARTAELPFWRQRRFLRGIAASVAVLIVSGALWYRQYTHVEPPAISTEVQQAMALSVESGRQEAQIQPVGTATQSRHAVAQTLKQKYHMTGQDAVEQLLEAHCVATRSDREFWLSLPDGSLVHLNYNTRVIYPERFTGDTRDVILDGEAYFMVARDRRHPFIVHTPQGNVKEYGTEFNVSTRGEAGTEVVLVEGSISITPTNGTEQRMQPGQKCLMEDVQCSTEDVDVETYVAWNTGKFSFQGWPLERVMAVLARWYGFERAVFMPDALRQKHLDGAFSRYDAVENIMESIATVLDLSIAFEQGTVIISQQP